MKSYKGYYCDHRFNSKKEMVSAMLKMRQEGWDNRSIAQRFNYCTQTIRKYIGNEPKALRSHYASNYMNDVWFRRRYQKLMSVTDKNALINMRHNMEVKKKEAENTISKIESDSKMAKYIAAQKEVAECSKIIDTIDMFV